jgi:hypothetical protein
MAVGDKQRLVADLNDPQRGKAGSLLPVNLRYTLRKS